MESMAGAPASPRQGGEVEVDELSSKQCGCPPADLEAAPQDNQEAAADGEQAPAATAAEEAAVPAAPLTEEQEVEQPSAAVVDREEDGAGNAADAVEQPAAPAAVTEGEEAVAVEAAEAVLGGAAAEQEVAMEAVAAEAEVAAAAEEEVRQVAFEAAPVAEELAGAQAEVVAAEASGEAEVVEALAVGGEEEEEDRVAVVSRQLSRLSIPEAEDVLAEEEGMGGELAAAAQEGSASKANFLPVNEPSPELFDRLAASPANDAPAPEGYYPRSKSVSPVQRKRQQMEAEAWAGIPLADLKSSPTRLERELGCDVQGFRREATPTHSQGDAATPSRSPDKLHSEASSRSPGPTPEALSEMLLKHKEKQQRLREAAALRSPGRGSNVPSASQVLIEHQAEAWGGETLDAVMVAPKSKWQIEKEEWDARMQAAAAGKEGAEAEVEGAAAAEVEDAAAAEVEDAAAAEVEVEAAAGAEAAGLEEFGEGEVAPAELADEHSSEAAAAVVQPSLSGHAINFADVEEDEDEEVEQQGQEEEEEDEFAGMSLEELEAALAAAEAEAAEAAQAVSDGVGGGYVTTVAAFGGQSLESSLAAAVKKKSKLELEREAALKAAQPRTLTHAELHPGGEVDEGGGDAPLESILVMRKKTALEEERDSAVAAAAPRHAARAVSNDPEGPSLGDSLVKHTHRLERMREACKAARAAAEEAAAAAAAGQGDGDGGSQAGATQVAVTADATSAAALRRQRQQYQGPSLEDMMATTRRPMSKVEREQAEAKARARAEALAAAVSSADDGTTSPPRRSSSRPSSPDRVLLQAKAAAAATSPSPTAAAAAAPRRRHETAHEGLSLEDAFKPGAKKLSKLELEIQEAKKSNMERSPPVSARLRDSYDGPDLVQTLGKPIRRLSEVEKAQLEARRQAELEAAEAEQRRLSGGGDPPKKDTPPAPKSRLQLEKAAAAAAAKAQKAAALLAKARAKKAAQAGEGDGEAGGLDRQDSLGSSLKASPHKLQQERDAWLRAGP